MLRRSVLLYATAIVLPLTALLVPPSVSAAGEPISQVVLIDPTGDVWRNPKTEFGEPVLAGDVPTADVIRAVARHGRGNVVVTMTFADLRRNDPQAYDVTIVGPRLFKAVFVWAGPGRWHGNDQLVNFEFGKVNCPKLVHDIRYDTDRVTIWIPRACIGRPEWVKVGLDNMMFVADDILNDNPHSNGPESSSTVRLYQAAS